ncbi:hypothetical protein MBLNU230_g8569t1 [Neophaeotheca triangularis]
MVMMNQTLPGQAPDSGNKNRRSGSFRRIAHSSKAALDKGVSVASDSSASGVNKRATGITAGGHSALPGAQGKHASVESMAVPRKKLPWLDGQKGSKLARGPGFIPGSFDSQLSLEETVLPQPATGDVEQPILSPTAAEQVQGKPRFDADSTLRPTVSTPSVRELKKEPIARRGSFNPTSRAGERQSRFQEDATPLATLKKPKAKPINTAESSPSEYSATMPSTEAESSPTGSVRRDSAPFVRQVQQSSDSYSQYVKTKADLRAQGVHATWNPVLPGYGSEASRPSSLSCTSCDHEVELRELPAVDAVSRRATSPATDDTLPSVRRKTITGMPSHMMLSTSETPSSSEPLRSPERAITRKDTLMPLPEHLDLSPPSSSTSSVHPTELNNAVIGLGDLVDQAVLVAQQAAERGQSDEATNILDSAAATLRKASTVHTRMSQPLITTATGPSEAPTSPYAPPVRPQSHSDSEAYLDASDDLTDDDSTIEYLDSHSDISTPYHSRANSEETVPTLFTNSAQPSRQPLGVGTEKPASETGSIHPTPSVLYHPPSAEFVVRDFAYWAPGKEGMQRAMRRSTSPTLQPPQPKSQASPLMHIDPVDAMAGEVPRIQYQLADLNNNVILGNVLLYIGLALTTLLAWPLPLLHGRKPYTLVAFAVMLPLQFPQAIVVSSYRNPDTATYRVGLLLPRVLTGIAMGFANINFLPTLLDLYGASLMSYKPHQEVVNPDDVRRQGGGMGMWLGLWSWCFVGSLSIGFWIGATIIDHLDPGWGFYIVVILLAFFLLVNVVAPETRRAPYRRSIHHFLDEDEKLRRRVARGEIKLHISNEGPKWWWHEAWAGVVLMKRMIFQPGFAVLMVYLAWIYCQVVFVILLIGALMSREYRWHPQYVGLAALSLAIGAFFAIPLSHANLFSRSRFEPQRTDSMTFQPSVTWSSHLLRRSLFSILLPFAGLAYTLASPGQSVHWGVPCTMAALVGFLSNLAISECIGIIMETFDTCDLQPGVNTKHRLQSLGEINLRRRTNYSAFPRICAGFFAAQAFGFFLAAAATGVSGDITRSLGAQTATAIVAGILLLITIMFILVLSRFKEVQVIPDGTLHGSRRPSRALAGGGASAAFPGSLPEEGTEDPAFKAVVIGNPSGKVRRVNLLELGALSRWTEIRKLNKLVPGEGRGVGGRGKGKA